MSFDNITTLKQSERVPNPAREDLSHKLRAGAGKRHPKYGQINEGGKEESEEGREEGADGESKV